MNRSKIISMQIPNRTTLFMTENKIERIRKFVGRVIKDYEGLKNNKTLSKEGKGMKIMAKALKQILDE